VINLSWYVTICKWTQNYYSYFVCKTFLLCVSMSLCTVRRHLPFQHLVSSNMSWKRVHWCIQCLEYGIQSCGIFILVAPLKQNRSSCFVFWDWTEAKTIRNFKFCNINNNYHFLSPVYQIIIFCIMKHNTLPSFLNLPSS